MLEMNALATAPAHVSPGHTNPDQARAHKLDWFILGRGNVVDQRGVPDYGGECVAVNVGAPLPARRVRVASADVLRLEALEFLLRA